MPCPRVPTDSSSSPRSILSPTPPPICPGSPTPESGCWTPREPHSAKLDVSDGRSGETALVLGSFRRRANGDWDFVTGGKGYEGGLEELVQEYGIDVE